jgi:hypothetical protein
VMKQTSGRADPKLTNQLLGKKLQGWRKTLASPAIDDGGRA